MFRFAVNGIVVECDTVEELFSAIKFVSSNTPTGASGSPQSASWAEAARIAEERGITKMEARQWLAQQRKKKVSKKLDD